MPSFLSQSSICCMAAAPTVSSKYDRVFRPPRQRVTRDLDPKLMFAYPGAVANEARSLSVGTLATNANSMLMTNGNQLPF
jgi:hypothetical protein